MAAAGPRKVIDCPWLSRSLCCKAYRSQDEVTADLHSECHQIALLRAWEGPTTCSWPNCSSSRVFKEKYLLKRHLQNIHVTPLCCPIAGCSHSEPFDKKPDLDRHVKSIHEGSSFVCPIESCDASTVGFPRKDKLVQHMRETHNNVRCLLNHCGAAILDGQQESHIQNGHGDYECALMACADGMPSRFTEETARLHLISAHKMYRETAGSALRDLICPDHKVRQHNSRRPLFECQGCLDHQLRSN
ncbi:hypothetical protein N431DRAFT_423163 [Stipitochalara longipes BDJ]|nr:hypothetical protein N431DRAFT_423163 [Stipitochalara longipes BDJ]